MDTDTELIALLAKLRKLQGKLTELESQQACTKEELARTQAKANELRQRSERHKSTGEEEE